MFKLFKEKLKNWTKKFSKEVEEEPKAEKTKEIKLPEKFNVGAQKYEPDTEKIQKIIEEIKSEEEPKVEKEKVEKTADSKKEKSGFFKSLGKKIKISEKEFEVYKEEFEMLLLENNVALEVSEKISEELKEKIIGKELLKKEAEEEVNEILKEIIRNILLEPFDVVERIKENKERNPEKPFVILFCGINGSGKTTSIAKIAEMLKEKNISSVMAAGDTFRAASIEQLKKHGERLGVKVVAHDYGTDPASVGFDAIKYAEKNRIDCVLIDTAGRMHTEKNLLKELEKVVRVCKPDLKIFVGESLTGNDAVEQAKTFNWHLGIDGSILTKADIDEKGGTALSVGFVTKKPILFLGTGQEYDKIEPFDKKKFIKRLGL